MASDAEIELVRRYCRKFESHLLQAIDKFEFDEEVPDDLVAISIQMALLTTKFDRHLYVNLST